MADEGGRYGRPERSLGERVWGDVSVHPVEHEDRLASEAADVIWSEIFRLYSAGGEAARREVKLAVYAYYAVNGASRRTKHSRDITTGGGASVLAADVVDKIGDHQIRQFLRADVSEAYSALKESQILERDEVFVRKASAKGVPRGYMHCAVDFLRGCPLMTQEEESYSTAHFEYSISRARGARGGVTVDEEDAYNRGRGLAQQRESSRVPVKSGRGSVDQF